MEPAKLLKHLKGLSIVKSRLLLLLFGSDIYIAKIPPFERFSIDLLPFPPPRHHSFVLNLS